MSRWARAPEPREQLVLFPTRLDEAVDAQHVVRLLERLLSRLDFGVFEAAYDVRHGQPAIHPRILTAVWLYGILRRIRSSRALEEAVRVRLDFRWLAQGHTPDHTTLSEFRRRHGEALQNLFVQVGLLAREMDCLPLLRLGFDGTRMRANNRRSGTRTPEELRKVKAELAAQFTAAEAQTAASDAADEEQFGLGAAHTTPAAWTDAAHVNRKYEQAVRELERLEAAGAPLPARLPLTDVDARIMPNKEGGSAVNYTPIATVDLDSGLIAAVDVIAEVNEDQRLIPEVEKVQAQFGGDQPPAVAADGLMNTGANLAALDERGLTFYSPTAPLPDHNPAQRADLTQPVPPEQWAQLPTKQVKKDGATHTRLDGAAFVYDEAADCYYCPQGERLEFRNVTPEPRASGETVKRRRYLSNAAVCAQCPLRALCLTPQQTRREASHDQYRALRQAHAERMATPEAQAVYAQRAPRVERVFATIKQQFGARQFLLRGLKRVRVEWCWLALGYNLSRLLSLSHQRARAGPAAATP